jgi:hypothetical protein
MDVVDVSRSQSGITTIDHFVFVPLTIGLGTADRGDANGLARHRQD